MSQYVVFKPGESIDIRAMDGINQITTQQWSRAQQSAKVLVYS
jgi:hypothetical protein